MSKSKDERAAAFMIDRKLEQGRFEHNGKAFWYVAYRMGNGSTRVDFSRFETPTQLLSRWNEDAKIADIIEWAKENGDLSV